MKSYAEIMDLVTDDELWAKKGNLVASTLYTRTQIHQSTDSALVSMFTNNTDAEIGSFKTSTGRPGRVIIAIGEDACNDADALFGEPHNAS